MQSTGLKLALLSWSKDKHKLWAKAKAELIFLTYDSLQNKLSGFVF